MADPVNAFGGEIRCGRSPPMSSSGMLGSVLKLHFYFKFPSRRCPDYLEDPSRVSLEAL